MQTRPSNPETLNYQRMHNWLRKYQGNADTRPCEVCGDTERKHAWSFDHEYAGDVRIGMTQIRGIPREAPWSPDPDAYQVLCASCHSKRDGFNGHSLKGVPKSAEHRAKIGAAVSGPRPHRQGVPQSEEHKRKRIEAVTHTRWHVGRGILEPNCLLCMEVN